MQQHSVRGTDTSENPTNKERSRSWRQMIRPGKQARSWFVCTALLVIAVSLPAIYVALHVFGGSNPVWDHLAATVLTDYVVNTFILMLGVAVLVTPVGVLCAWLISAYDFPGRAWLEWALVLPLAMPAYITGYAWSGIFEYGGPIDSLAAFLGFGSSLGIDIFSIYFLAALFAFVLYPYVYLVARSSFARQSAGLIEAARLTGAGNWEVFRRVAMPLARPAVAGGLALCLMEVLNDYGAVKYFGVSTFTTGIFRAWFALGDTGAAVRLAAVLMLFVFVLIVLERRSRARTAVSSSATMRRQALRGKKAVLALIFCLVPLSLGFIIPVARLLTWAWRTASNVLDLQFVYLVLNSFALALGSAVLCCAAAIIVLYTARLQRTRLAGFLAQSATLGYSIPGAVIAVGVMTPFAAIDHGIDGFVQSLTGGGTGLLLSGTLIALLYAYLSRYLAVAFQPVDAGFERTAASMDEAARSLGASPLRALLQINIPMVRTAILSAIILVFVDVLKELPLTLILRPFNFETLATRAFEFAGNEQLAEAANPALLIVAVGVIPIVYLNRLMNAKQAR